MKNKPPLKYQVITEFSKEPEYLRDFIFKVTAYLKPIRPVHIVRMPAEDFISVESALLKCHVVVCPDGSTALVKILFPFKRNQICMTEEDFIDEASFAKKLKELKL